MPTIPTENLILGELQDLKKEAQKTNELLGAIYQHLVDFIPDRDNPLK
ncbi:hypothetical protein KYN89_10150 [Alteriqipengyuania sp. NZ-12B]|uniref:IS66 family transposase n=1 Tax=Alteriqipengyuania abyssalis TaxID=2860200 RepID=A0ABS7PEA1_9SPHN|nr:hypothetical protein [Alteriqipengyuania abyssalis]MBY8337413.1 hypothetical protein [Alteriqipengyuania abyssalis]